MSTFSAPKCFTVHFQAPQNCTTEQWFDRGGQSLSQEKCSTQGPVDYVLLVNHTGPLDSSALNSNGSIWPCDGLKLPSPFPAGRLISTNCTVPANLKPLAKGTIEYPDCSDLGACGLSTQLYGNDSEAAINAYAPWHYGLANYGVAGTNFGLQCSQEPSPSYTAGPTTGTWAGSPTSSAIKNSGSPRSKDNSISALLVLGLLASTFFAR